MPGDDVGSLATHLGSSSSSRKGHDDDIVIVDDDAAQAAVGPVQAGAREVEEAADLVFSLHLEIIRLVVQFHPDEIVGARRAVLPAVLRCLGWPAKAAVGVLLQPEERASGAEEGCRCRRG